MFQGSHDEACFSKHIGPSADSAQGCVESIRQQSVTGNRVSVTFRNSAVMNNYETVDDIRNNNPYSTKDKIDKYPDSPPYIRDMYRIYDMTGGKYVVVFDGKYGNSGSYCLF